MCVKLLHLALHHPQSAAHSYRALAAASLSVCLGVPRVQDAVEEVVIDMQLLDWMMGFLNAPSMQIMSEHADLLGRVKRRRLSASSVRSVSSKGGASEDLNFMLTLCK